MKRRNSSNHGLGTGSQSDDREDEKKQERDVDPASRTRSATSVESVDTPAGNMDNDETESTTSYATVQTSPSLGPMAGSSQAQVTGKSAMTIDDLPHEWLEQILRFISTTELHGSCMRVNRDWEFATRYVLKHRKSLKLIHLSEYEEYNYKQWGLHGLPLLMTDEWHLIKTTKRTDNQLLIKSLSKMTGVEVLQLDNTFDTSRRLDSESQLASLFAPNLKSLKMSDRLVVLGVNFPKLEILECHVFDANAAAACPRLKSLQADNSTVDAIFALPAERMESLNAGIYTSNITSAVLVDHMLRMQNMKHLEVVFGHSYDDFEFEFEPMIRLFSGYTKLQYLGLIVNSSSPSCGEKVDAAIEQLVKQNPRLQSLKSHGFHHTERSLDSLSRLQHLQELSLDDVRLTDNSPAAVVRFLRTSASRKRLQTMFLRIKSHVNCEPILHEMQSIAKERGKEVHASVDSYDDGMSASVVMKFHNKRKTDGVS